MTTLPELRSRLKGVRTMHADTRTPEEAEAWKAEEELIRQLDAAEKAETRLRGELELMRTRLAKAGVTP